MCGGLIEEFGFLDCCQGLWEGGECGGGYEGGGGGEEGEGDGWGGGRCVMTTRDGQ